MIYSPRHRAREVAFQVLYQRDLLSTKQPISPDAWTGEIEKEVRSHFEHFEVSSDVAEFAVQLVGAVLTKRSEWDALIESMGSEWKIARMAIVDRNVLRLATAELYTLPDTPPAIVINEAIEIAKQFGAAESPGFVNGVLDAIHRKKP